MSSGKQRRAEIKKRRATRKAKAADKRPPKPLPTGTAPVAKHCRACRREARARSEESRRLHLEGLARKKKKLL